MAYCTSCGRTIAGDEPYCRTCGAPTTGPTPIPTAAAPPGPEETSLPPLPPPGPPDGNPPMPPSGTPLQGPQVRRSGPSRALIFVATAALVAVVVLSVLLAKRHANATPPPTDNASQFAVSSALQAADQVYDSNRNAYPRGQSLISQLQQTDPQLLFAFGPQSFSFPNNASAPLDPSRISVGVSQDGEVIMFAALANNGDCWYATDNHETRPGNDGLEGASRTSGVTYASSSGQTSCTAGAGLPGNVTAWAGDWSSV
jgi:hypothetical protein